MAFFLRFGRNELPCFSHHSGGAKRNKQQQKKKQPMRVTETETSSSTTSALCILFTKIPKTLKVHNKPPVSGAKTAPTSDFGGANVKQDQFISTR